MPIPTHQSDLVTFSEDFKRLQKQKTRMHGGVEARILTNLGFYYSEHYLKYEREALRTNLESDRNRLNLVFDLLGKQIRRRIGRLSSVSPEAGATPDKKDPKAYDQAEVVDQLVMALQKKAKERHLMWMRYFWLLLGGVVVEHTPWVLNTHEEPVPQFNEAGELIWVDQLTGQDVSHSQVLQIVQSGITPERFIVKEELQLVGDVGSEIVSPLNFFIDAATTSIRAIPPDQACYLAEIKSVGWLAETFNLGPRTVQQLEQSNRDLGIVKTRLHDQQPGSSGFALKDMIPAIQGSRSADDPPMAVVLTRYQPAGRQWPRGRRTILVPDEVILDDLELPYEDIPAVDIHWEPNATTFWSKDFVTPLIPAQKFLNKRVSQLGEAANAQVYEILLLGGELSKDTFASDRPDVIEDGLNEDGSPRVAPVQRQGLPTWFLESIRFVMEFMERVSGADLMGQPQYPGQLRGSLTVPLIQEILDSEDGPFFEHLGEQLAHIYQQRVNRVKQYYEPIRTLHYTDSDSRDEVLVFHKSQVLEAGTEFNISIDRRSLVPELAALREARIRERLESPLAILYTDRRTGQVDPTLIAHDLKIGDRARISKAAKYRKLAVQIIAKLWRGEVLDPTIPMPFWDHAAMMDEMEDAMATTEWLSASQQVKQAFVILHEKHRRMLAAIQQQQMQAVEGRMMQGAVAQATQQAAAKAASVAADAAIQQVMAQSDLVRRTPMEGRVMEAMQGQSGPRRSRPMAQEPARVQ